MKKKNDHPKWEIPRGDTTIRLIDPTERDPVFTRKIWRLETETDNDISDLLTSNGIDHMRFFSKKDQKLVYWIYDKEDFQTAKFFI